MRTYAVVGSGPSGFYATEAIIKAQPEARVDVFDRLPTPYGLVRSGVAPDHQGTKNVWRVFQRTAQRPGVRFFGNVEIGKDLSVAELRRHYDGVVFAIGAPIDRKLGIAGEELTNVVGSSTISGWYNGHPDHTQAPDLGQGHIVVLGNGNVAVDVVRVLARSAEEMLKTDLPRAAREHIARAPITDIHMVGRRGPLDASFTPVELRELGEIARTVALVDKTQLPTEVHVDDPQQQKLKEKIVDILRGYSENDPSSKPVKLHFHFYAAPRVIEGNGRAERIVFDRTKVENGKAIATGESFSIPATLIIRAIGFHILPLTGLPGEARDTHYRNVDGKVDECLYVVGWAKRGPSGVIATNRQDSIDVVTRMLTETAHHETKNAREHIDQLLTDRKVPWVTFADWEKIETHENELAKSDGHGAPRTKLTTWEALLSVARS